MHGEGSVSVTSDGGVRVRSDGLANVSESRGEIETRSREATILWESGRRGRGVF